MNEPTPAPPGFPRGYACPRVPASLAPPPGGRLSGRLDTPFWAAAPWTDDFIDIEGPPPIRPAPPLRTRAKMLWDDHALYVGALMEEPRVWATLTRHDEIVYHDHDFEVFLNPTADSHRYYEVEVNALGTIFDLFLPKPYRDGGPADHDWNCAGLRRAVHVDGHLNDPAKGSRAWSVELAIPWASLDRHGGPGLPPSPGDVWRINFSRVEWDLEVVAGAYRKVQGRPEHNWVWSAQGVIDMHRPERWGLVRFDAACGGPADSHPPFPPSPPPRDPDQPALDLLHRVYHAQRRHHAALSRWATSLHELAAFLPSGAPPLAAPSLTLRPTADGWVASTVGHRGPVHLRHDSRVLRGEVPT
jgi:hypothetical protein